MGSDLCQQMVGLGLAFDAHGLVDKPSALLGDTIAAGHFS